MDGVIALVRLIATRCPMFQRLFWSLATETNFGVAYLYHVLESLELYFYYLYWFVWFAFFVFYKQEPFSSQKLSSFSYLVWILAIEYFF